jgi:hypothetical protein
MINILIISTPFRILLRWQNQGGEVSVPLSAWICLRNFLKWNNSKIWGTVGSGRDYLQLFDNVNMFWQWWKLHGYLLHCCILLASENALAQLNSQTRNTEYIKLSGKLRFVREARLHTPLRSGRRPPGSSTHYIWFTRAGFTVQDLSLMKEFIFSFKVHVYYCRIIFRFRCMFTNKDAF